MRLLSKDRLRRPVLPAGCGKLGPSWLNCCSRPAGLQRFGLTVDAIVRLNPKLQNNPDLIQPGTLLVLRRCRQPARRALF